ncbi:MAG: transcription termination factor NusA [Candidatus Zambryskibacteria bacterium RIFCSPLOWO2_02_FULL_39_26]|uniref:Transcription termination/antitermination protein NusA n=1 Tax=Candidatus Zambryskibacteria bacterium RIFCSPLOWO2_12_FULL_39_23 TaxID=1802776 RepID=A0A1G2UR79_9BACT|nr:MAG: transcription termination factor NusA [Candidatus Zambryskibacteria bacterium RIFCSPHIGHO2_02_39_10]OHB00248.1 MAG: transcription termination factor NusA [Candidatus Zambryskibacteria bacterium RIFCSPHIGHO2_12_FULL_39_47]OHB10067.1 MAG: transcription termination factor NusA [Candidatus Zambryskibacteria bacterium RIFCSPLOWO2_02_FULL_39_26]OHB11897.1 MAG: transcription termination factor NusA [Candidatus Zambryskibacteria bacterium RIFCSPLOWO2_12_FULL_39_23]
MTTDLKVINSVLSQLEEERGIPREKILEAIELALATAYKKEYGKKGQIIRAKFDINTGKTEMFQVKIVVDESTVALNEEELLTSEAQTISEEVKKDLYNPEHHIMLGDGRRIKKDVRLGEEMIFPLEHREDYSRIAAQTAKQVIMQKIREAEKVSVLAEYGKREGEIVSGTVQRVERGNIFIDMGRATGLLPYEEQIPGERFGQGERVRAYLYRVEESGKGIFLRLSRSHPKFLEKLFETEAPEIANGTVVIKSVAREAGSRTKIAVTSRDSHIDPVGSMVGQRGVRVSTVMSELGGEKIDIIEWSEDQKKFIEDALSPAKVLEVEINEEEKRASVTVSEDQQSLAIGKGGQNVRLAAKLTGWKIDIQSTNPRGEMREVEEDEGE